MSEPDVKIDIDMTDPTAVRQRLAAQGLELAAQAAEIERYKDAIGVLQKLLDSIDPDWRDKIKESCRELRKIMGEVQQALTRTSS